MNWRLGLDLGTNSIGWAAIALNGQGEPESLIDFNSRIFSDGRDPKSGEPLATERRMARGIRRNIHRRRQRRRAIFRLLQSEGLFPKTKEEAARLKALDPYALRVRALETKLLLHELGRALFHLGVRRGFKSNRKDAAEEKKKKEQSAMLAAVEELKQKLGGRTIGQYLYDRLNKSEGARFRPIGKTEKPEYDFYPSRQMYAAEFDAIQHKQKEFYPNIQWDKIKKLILYQKELTPQIRGKCQFDLLKKRTFKAMPCSIRLRILQEVYNLKFINDRNERVELTEEQRKIIIDMLNESKDKITFKKLKKELKTKCEFNLEYEARTSLDGNPTEAVLCGKDYFGELWESFELVEKDEIVEKLLEAKGEADEAKLTEFLLSRYSLKDEQIKNIIKYVPKAGTAAYCKEITEQLVTTMEEEKCDRTAAIKKLGLKEHGVEKSETLLYYGKVIPNAVVPIVDHPENYDENQYPEKRYGKIANPTVHIALNQTRILINSLIKKYGKPAQVVIELSRDLKASRDSKAEMIKRHSENVKRNAIHNKNIIEAAGIAYPNRADRLKWRLWLELGENELSRRCIYCGKVISASELYTNNIQVEHILPFSRTLLDSESNLTIAHAECNAAKGNKSPYEAFGSSPAGYNWSAICERVDGLPRGKKKRFAVNAMEDFEKESGFIARQLTDNAYLSKTARRYLKSICDDVWSVSVGMTKLLRDKWEVDSMLKRKIGDVEIAHFNLNSEQIGNYKKNRYDHRHHALDAMVIALIDRSMVQEISTMNARSQKHRIEAPQFPFVRAEVIEKLRNAVVSHKPDHGIEGKLSKETQLGVFDVDGTKVYGNRVPIASLSPKNIENHISTPMRIALQKYINVHNERTLKENLEKYCEEFGVKRVRCRAHAQDNLAQFPSKNKKQKVRWYEQESCFCAIVWELPSNSITMGDKKYEASYIRRTDKINTVKKLDVLPNVAYIEVEKGVTVRCKKPHPAARKVCVLFRGDYIEFSQDGVLKKALIRKLNASANSLTITPIFAATEKYDIKSWEIATAEQVGETGWEYDSGGICTRIVDKLFGKHSAQKITVSPIGEVRRQKR